MITPGKDIPSPSGRLGILLPGLGAVATTFIAGVMAIRRGLAEPIGSLTQMGTIRLGKRTDNRTPRIADFVPLAGLDDLVFAAWDIFPDDAYEAAHKAGVLEPELLRSLAPDLHAIRPMSAVFSHDYVLRLDGDHVKRGADKWELAEQLGADIERFRRESRCDRLVMIWCASTEVYREPTAVHASLDSFERGLRESHPDIAPSMIYAYAALKAGVPFANGAPNLTGDIPALLDLTERRRVPVAGKDFKTGQTLIKTILAPG